LAKSGKMTHKKNVSQNFDMGRVSNKAKFDADSVEKGVKNVHKKQ
jgi:hypothetical protein